MKEIWRELWNEYTAEWSRLWKQYKTIVGPFVKGTANYLWHLIEGFLILLTKGIYRSGKYLVEAFMQWFKKI